MSGNMLVTSDDIDASDIAAQEDIEHRANDETEAQSHEREQREYDDADLRSKLCDPKKCRAVYRDLADAHTALGHAPFRVLSYLLRRADPDLTNAFPSQKTAAKELGMERGTYNSHLVALRHAGWVRTYEFHNEGRQSSSGVQFCIPKGVLPLGESWDGPIHFERDYGAPKAPRRRDRMSKPVVQSVNNRSDDS